MIRTDINDLDGKPIAWSVAAPGDGWTWIVHLMVHLHGCAEDEVDLLETDDGDLILVRGEPVAVPRTRWPR